MTSLAKICKKTSAPNMYFKQPHLGSLDSLTIPTMRVDHLVRYPIWMLQLQAKIKGVMND